MTKPQCSMSLDLDNKWSYMKTHGDAGWEAFPTYFDVMVPRVLEILQRRSWRITFFVVGRDASIEANREALAAIPAMGHEIANHSFRHEPWLHLYSRPEIEHEIVQAEEAIEACTGIRPRGFRGPGYSLSRSTLEVLAKRDYEYDASAFPTYLGPLARAYYFMTSDFSKEEKRQRAAMFGGWRHGFRPLRPYRWGLDGHNLIEIPVTTMPIAKIPFHFSYLFFIGTYSEALAVAYLKIALRLCRITGIEPSLLLHPLDFLGNDDAPELGFFPAMRIESSVKLALLERLFDEVDRHYDVHSLAEHAAKVRARKSVKIRSPDYVALGEKDWEVHP